MEVQSPARSLSPTVLRSQLSFNDLLDKAADAKEKAQLLSQKGKGASQFLTLRPTDGYATLSDEEFHAVIREYLGLSLAKRYLKGFRHCDCFRHPDLSDYHMQTCPWNKSKARHDAVKRCLAAAAREAGLVVTDEPAVVPAFGGARAPANRTKLRADLLVQLGGDQEVVIDVTIVHPSVGDAGNVANVQRVTRHKTNKYDPHMHGHQLFTVAAMEYFGACAEGTQWILNAFKHAGEYNGRLEGARLRLFKMKWYQRLSMALRKYAAKRSCLPSVVSAPKCFSLLCSLLLFFSRFLPFSSCSLF